MTGVLVGGALAGLGMLLLVLVLAAAPGPAGQRARAAGSCDGPTGAAGARPTGVRGPRWTGRSDDGSPRWPLTSGSGWPGCAPTWRSWAAAGAAPRARVVVALVALFLPGADLRGARAGPESAGVSVPALARIVLAVLAAVPTWSSGPGGQPAA